MSMVRIFYSIISSSLVRACAYLLLRRIKKLRPNACKIRSFNLHRAARLHSVTRWEISVTVRTISQAVTFRVGPTKRAQKRPRNQKAEIRFGFPERPTAEITGRPYSRVNAISARDIRPGLRGRSSRAESS